jgi:hypothetical protein
VVSQSALPNLRGRGVRFDILARDKSGKIYNIEVQRSDTGAVPKRARYNSAMLDTNTTAPGDDYDALPESYVIFITESDVLKKRFPLYHIDRIVRETGEAFGDDAHIIYVNGEYRGNDPIGALMHDFRCTEPDDMYSTILSKETGYYKKETKGVSSMCKIMEDFVREEREESRAEGREEGRVKELLKNIATLTQKGMSLEDALNLLDVSEADRALLRGE